MANTYSYDQVNELIQVATLANKLTALEGKYETLIDKMETAISNENAYGERLEKTVDELKTKLDSSSDNLYQCKAEVEDTLKTGYVTNEQLKIALMEMQTSIQTSITSSNEALRKEFKHFGESINKQVRANTDLLTKYRNYGAAGVSIALAISWAVGLYINASKIDTTKRVEVSQSETIQILNQMKSQQDAINKQHEAILKHQGVEHE